MTRTKLIIASTILTISAAPVWAGSNVIAFDAANTLAGQTAEVSTISVENGGSVFTNSGVELGKITDFSIDNQQRAEIFIDLANDSKFKGERMVLSADPADITVKEGSIAVNASEDELFVLQNANSDPAQTIKINL